MADISNELNTISEDKRGRNVKQAIHDALMKINQDVEENTISGGEVFHGVVIAVRTANVIPQRIPCLAEYTGEIEEVE